MIEQMIKEVLVAAELEAIALSGIGGAVAYLITYYQGKYRQEGGRTDFIFDWVLFIIQIIVGLFAGYVVQDIVKDYEEYKNIMIAMSGFIAIPVLKIVESRGAETIFEFLFKGKGGKK